MNYLAHLALSGDNSDVMCGNYLADSLRPQQRHGWTDDMIAGYQLHLEIDAYTDGHPAFVAAKRRLQPDHQKYAPVVLDILNDHLLSINWDAYNPLRFNVWSLQVYDRLQPYLNYNLPPKANALLSGLIEHQYLHVYTTKEGVHEVMVRMDRRARFPSRFAAAAEHLYQDFLFYEACFFDLYGDLMKHFDPYVHRTSHKDTAANPLKTE